MFSKVVKLENKDTFHFILLVVSNAICNCKYSKYIMDIIDHVNFKIVNSVCFIGLAIQQPRLLCNLGSWFLGSRKILRFLQISEDFRHTTGFASFVHSYHGSGRTFFTNAILDVIEPSDLFVRS